ncbi:PREDICTED: protein CBFA2T2 isoform X4 [Nanorana parkeri]|uniref:protein CBFA2T2 isoform X4 n=1 Tax=Nanorana parkeri TaxID=125878 RepID=UPI0008541765|nr:PREDICTED: protein CBFA2T2 isoform X4 [Nanorana parkeri]
MVGIPGSFQFAGDKRVPAMPGSPMEVKIHSRSSPPTMAPLPPVNPSGPRPVSFPPSSLSNGMNHSPSLLNGAPSPPQRSSNGPSSSSSSSLANQQLPATCGVRQLSKLKRFLTTLQQFGNDISPEIGEKVRTLVLALVNSTITIEEFHCKLQEATNFPLRPFVIPFLKANLPLLQRELLHCARTAKQTPSQYLAQHEHLLLNTNTASPPDSSELLMEVNGNGKRHSPERREDSMFEREPLPPEPPMKRVCTISPAPRHSPALSLPLLTSSNQFHPTPPPLQHYSLDDIPGSQLYRDPLSKMGEHREVRERHHPVGGINGNPSNGYQEELVDHRLTEREWAEEWKHLDHALNCIMEMVEKTRRSMSVLRRCQEVDREELNYWKRRYNESSELRKGSEHSSRQHSPSSTESGANEEAVNEVKRQAVSEVQKAVSEAEQKAFEMIASERARMEQTIADTKRRATEDAFLVVNEQEESTETCWNCGRKASETCSGCNIARYCGSFCQHKDWEKHHRICGQTLHGPAKALTPMRSLLPKPSDPILLSPAVERSSSGTSRSSTPASVAAVESL